MSKKIIGIVAAVFIIAAIVITIAVLTKEENLEEVKLPLQIDFLERTVSAMVGYPKDTGVVVEDTERDNSKIFKNEQENYKLEISLTEDTTYKYNKDYSSKKTGYEEVQFNDFTGYIIKGKYDIRGSILLEDINSNVYIYLNIVFKPIKSGAEVEKLYQLDEVQKILNSLKYDKGENTVEETKNAIAKKEEEKKTKNYGEFANRDRKDGTSDKDGLIFIPSFKSPDETLYKAEQKNDNVGVDNYLWYMAEKSAYYDSGIEVRIFPKTESYNTMEEYIQEKGDMYHWSKTTIAGKEYDTYTFGSSSSVPQKFSKYHSGAFMVGNKVVEFSYNMYAEIPNQDLGDTFFKQIIDSIEYSKDFK